VIQFRKLDKNTWLVKTKDQFWKDAFTGSLFRDGGKYYWELSWNGHLIEDGSSWEKGLAKKALRESFRYHRLSTEGWLRQMIEGASNGK